jgi:F420-0:gamma-glutamyl ligase-like protein
VSKYLPKAEKTTEFDGDQVTIRVGRISMADAMALRSVPRDELSDHTEVILHKYGLEFIGVKDANGVAMSTADVLAAFYFNDLKAAAAELLMECARIPEELARPLEQRSH